MSAVVWPSDLPKYGIANYTQRISLEHQKAEGEDLKAYARRIVAGHGTHILQREFARWIEQLEDDRAGLIAELLDWRWARIRELLPKLLDDAAQRRGNVCRIDVERARLGQHRGPVKEVHDTPAPVLPFKRRRRRKAKHKPLAVVPEVNAGCGGDGGAGE